MKSNARWAVEHEIFAESLAQPHVEFVPPATARAFVYRRLVRVAGMLTQNSDKGAESAHYTMWDASLCRATQPDIARWFIP